MRSTTSTSKAELIKRQAKMLFSAYRRDDFADPELFIAQLGMVFEGYPDEVIVTVTSPRTGIQRRIKFPPSIAEVVEACDAETVAMDTRRRYAAMPSRPAYTRLPVPPDDRPGRRANLFVSMDAPQYQAAYEWAMGNTDAADWRWDKERGGIWVNWWASPLGGLRCQSWNPLKAEVRKAS